ncbi:hypothetical protein [Deinococcus sp. YIM 77859]|uniref:hypothetical protein n=1 Tax=Deinococcus sp. YIM 77859 TaxID=1540221 RepID=UPI000B0F63FB|nr:hypothetical protein [Deinococcus sp. YIM 77859]
MPILVPPSERYKTSFLDAVREAQASGSGRGDPLSRNIEEAGADFGAFVAALRRFESLAA